MEHLDIDWLKTISGAGAAVASAVLLSTLGAAGTLVGAAVGSVVFTVASAVFTKGLVTSKQTLAKAQASAVQKVGVAQAEVRRAERVDDTAARRSHLAHAEDRLDLANRELNEAVAGARRSPLPWKRIGLLSAGLFVVAVVALTAFEVAAGRPVSSLTGGSSGSGTTIGDVGGSGTGRQQEQPPSQAPTDGTEPTEAPAPSETPLETPPTPTPTPTPEVSGTPAPGSTAPEPTPSASP